MDAKQYAELLLQEAGVSDEAQRKAFLDVIGNEKAAKRLSEDVMMHADYARNMDKLRKQEQDNAAYYQKLLDWEKTAQQQLEQQQPVIQQVQPDLTKFQDELSKSWEKKLAERDGQFLGLLKVGMTLASRHAVEFKEPLDTAAIEKIAVEKQLPLAQAYDEYVAPRRAQAQAEQRKAELENAKAEAVRDFASTHKIPVDARPREFHTLLDRDPKKQVGVDDYKPNSGELSPRAQAQLAENFAEAWNSATAGTSGK